MEDKNANKLNENIKQSSMTHQITKIVELK